MRVNKFTVKIPTTPSGTTIAIPISQLFQPMDQAEIVERDFVDKEIEKSINDIIDYEKARFVPVNSSNNQIRQLVYNINLLDSGTFPTTTMYSHAGFEYDDIKFSRNTFRRSFLELKFYDSDSPTNQNLISFMTLFSRLTTNDILPITQLVLLTISTGVMIPYTQGDPVPVGSVVTTTTVGGGGLPNPIDNIPLKFVVQDPIRYPEAISEGYHIYHFKSEVTNTLPKELFMRASWNSAKTGKRTILITDPKAKTIDNLVPKLHMRYLLKRDNTRYYYEIDMSYSSPSNITLVNSVQTIQLYEIQAL